MIVNWMARNIASDAWTIKPESVIIQVGSYL